MKALKSFSILFIFSLILLLAVPESTFAQCPMCKATVESSLKDGSSKAGLGLNDGILYLLSLPYLALGIIGYVWYRGYRKNKA